MPFANIGAGNSNRRALLITSGGGFLVNTPPYENDKNIKSSFVIIDLNEDGIGAFKSNTIYKNYLFERIFSLIHLPKKDQKKSLFENLTVGSLIINSFLIEDISNNIPTGHLSFEGSINKYASKVGSRMFVEPIVFNKIENQLGDLSGRILDIYQPFGYTTIDTVLINIPNGFILKNNPVDTVFKSVFGQFSYSLQIVRDGILVIRAMKLNEGTFKKEYFSEIDSFVKSVSLFEKKKIIFLIKI